MNRPTPAVLTIVAALGLAATPVLALGQGVTEPLSLLGFGVTAATTALIWGGYAGGKWASLVVTVRVVWRTLRAFHFGWLLQDRVPYFLLWRFTHFVAGLCLIAATILLWKERSRAEAT